MKLTFKAANLSNNASDNRGPEKGDILSKLLYTKRKKVL